MRGSSSRLLAIDFRNTVREIVCCPLWQNVAVLHLWSLKCSECGASWVLVVDEGVLQHCRSSVLMGSITSPSAYQLEQEHLQCAECLENEDVP